MPCVFFFYLSYLNRQFYTHTCMSSNKTRESWFLTDGDQNGDESCLVVRTRLVIFRDAVTRIRDCTAAPMCHAGVKRPDTRKWPRTVATATGRSRERVPTLHTTDVQEQWSYRGDINTTTVESTQESDSDFEVNGAPTPGPRAPGLGLSRPYRPDRNVSMRISKVVEEEIRRRSWPVISSRKTSTTWDWPVRCCAIWTQRTSG